MANVRNCIKKLERLSLVTCSEEVLCLLERTLANVEPVLKVDTKNLNPLLWHNELSMDRLHSDQVKNRLEAKDLKKNAASFYEDYIAIGPLPKKTNE